MGAGGIWLVHRRIGVGYIDSFGTVKYLDVWNADSWHDFDSTSLVLNSIGSISTSGTSRPQKPLKISYGNYIIFMPLTRL